MIGTIREPAAFLKVSEAAAIMGMSRATLYGKIGSGEIPSARFGKAVRIPRQQFEAYLLASAWHGSTADPPPKPPADGQGGATR